MKRYSLKPISVTLQGLLAVTASADLFTGKYLYMDPDPPYSADADITSEQMAWTKAQYSGASVTIARWIAGYNSVPTWETELYDPMGVTGTLVIASWTWNGGSYSDCFCEVWEPANQHNIVDGTPATDGGYSEIWH